MMVLWLGLLDSPSTTIDIQCLFKSGQIGQNIPGLFRPLIVIFPFPIDGHIKWPKPVTFIAQYTLIKFGHPRFESKIFEHLILGVIKSESSC